MLRRFPKSKDILQVYAVIAVMLSGWTITAFLRKLPSWLLTLNVGEILTVFSYSMVTNLVESLMVLLPLLLLCILLPPRFLRDDFPDHGVHRRFDSFVGNLSSDRRSDSLQVMDRASGYRAADSTPLGFLLENSVCENGALVVIRSPPCISIYSFAAVCDSSRLRDLPNDCVDSQCPNLTAVTF
jgi:hypothetical protein